MHIRPETALDYPAIRQVNKLAFGRESPITISLNNS